MSRWFGVHNDEDEVAFEMPKPEPRYEEKKAKCRLLLSELPRASTSTRRSSSIRITLSSAATRSYSVVFSLRLKKR